MAQRAVLLTRVAAFALLCGLAACGGGTPSWQQARLYRHNAGNYRAPGPQGDPWRPYIQEASSHFGIPDRWIRQVMRQESGGHEYLNGGLTTSGAGAMGLMQIMPATYDTLKNQYGLGDDPYDPHDNIMAGAGYIRQMYDRFGSPGFLAAYNAGPQRLQDYLDGRSNLPNETVNYVASIAPTLGSDRAMSGPLAAYADAAVAPESATEPAQAPVLPPAVLPPAVLAPAVLAPAVLAPAPARVRYAAATPTRAGCPGDPDVAYDTACPAAVPAIPAPVITSVAAADCVRDPDAAFDVPCASQPAALPRPPPPPRAPIAVAAAADCLRDPDAAFDAPCPPAMGRQSPPAAGQSRQPAAVGPALPAASGGTLLASSTPRAAGSPAQAGSLFNSAHAEELPRYAQRPASAVYAPQDRTYAPALPLPPAPPMLEVAALPEPPPPPNQSVWRSSPLPPPTPTDLGTPRFASPAPPAPMPAPSVYARREVAATRTPFAAPPALPLAGPLAVTGGAWGVQVGAFADRSLARSEAEAARGVLGREAGYPATAPTSPFGGAVLYRARLLGLSQTAAADACDRLARARQRCMIVPPGG